MTTEEFEPKARLYEQLGQRMAAETLRTQIAPRAAWALHVPPGQVAPSCGHGEPRWLDWCAADAVRLLCDDCLKAHLGSDAGDPHWDLRLKRCITWPFTWTKDPDTVIAKATEPRHRKTTTMSVTEH